MKIKFINTALLLLLCVIGSFKLTAQTTTEQLKVTLKNAQSLKVIPGTRVRLYKNGNWNSDQYTDTNGQVNFSIDTGANISYSLTTTVYNDNDEWLGNIETGGNIDFLVGEVDITLRGSSWTTVYSNNKVTIRKKTGSSSSSFYKYINSDANGKILMNLPDLSTGTTYLLYSTSPTDNISYSMEVSSKGVYDFFLTSTPPSKGRDAFTRLEAEDYDVMYGIQTETCIEGGLNIGYIEKNDWIMFKDVKFDNQTALSFSARVAAKNDNGGKIEVRLGSKTGTLVGTVAVEHTGGWQTWETVNANLNQQITGLHDIYFVFTGITSSLLNLNWLEFSTLPIGKNPFNTIEAENFDTMYGVKTEPCSEGGEDIGYIASGDWVAYKDYDFGTTGAASISARVSSDVNSGGTFDIRLGSTTGNIVGSFAMNYTGGWQTWETYHADLIHKITGRHDIYITFSGGHLNMNWLNFSKKAAPANPAPPVTPPTDPVTPPTDPITPPAGKDPFINIEVESFDAMYGVKTEPCSEGGEDIGYIASGDWVAYKGLDFGATGALSISARVASDVSSGGNFDIRLGSTTGEIVGSFVMHYTGGWQTWESYHADLTQKVTGVQDVYIMFTNGNMNMNWLKFNQGLAPENPVPPTPPTNPGSSIPADPVAEIPYPDFVSPVNYPASNSAPAAHTFGAVKLEKKILAGDQVIPFTTGVPFSRGILKSANNVRLLKNNTVTPAQFQVLSNWPDGSIKSLLVITQIKANSTDILTLEYGTTVNPTTSNSSLKITKGTADITVDTGKLKLVLTKSGPLFKSLTRDINNNNIYETSEKYLKDGDIFLVNAFDKQEYLASKAVDTEITVEEEGSERVVICLDGSLTSSTGDKLTKFRVRIYAYNNSDIFDIDYTLIDDRSEDVQRSHDIPALSINSYGIRWSHTLPQVNYNFGIDNTVTSGNLSTTNSSTYLLQNGDSFIEDGAYNGNIFNVSGAANGLKADGWMNISSANTTINLMVKDFWQNYPNEFSIDQSSMTVSLHPARLEAFDTVQPPLTGTRYLRPKTFYNPAEGMAKTYQLRLQITNKQLIDEVKLANNNFQSHGQNMTTEQNWILNSGVFGNLNVGNQDAAQGFDAHMLESIYKRSMQDGKISVQYGWRDYGDRMRPGYNITKSGLKVKTFYNDTHIGSNKFFRQYLRTGDDRWFELAENATRHFMDIDVSHGYRYGYFRTGTKQPAGEVRAIAHEMMDHQSRNLHLGHAQISGLSDYYLLTGDKRALDVIHEIGNWWKFMIPNFYKLPFNWDNGYFEAERDYAWPLYVLNEYVRVTNDQEYHRKVNAHLIQFLIDWWKTPQPHKVKGVVVGQNDYRQGTGWWTMTRMDNANGTDSNGTNPWMAGPLIGNIALFLEADKYIGSSIKHEEVEEMLLQTTNYVVKYGYKDAIGGFVYCEITEDKGYPTDSQIIFGLMYAQELFKSRQADGKLINPAWYDTQHKWNKIIKDHEIEYRTKSRTANSTELGWYGYTFPYPLDVFKKLGKY